MSLPFTVVIPARYASSRLPGKPLADIVGKPMIAHVVEKAKLSGAKRIIVATDHQQVAEAVQDLCEVCLTSAKHNSGTERLAEVVEKCHLPEDEIVVNVQGDEPLIPPVIIQQVAQNLEKFQVNMATLAVKIQQAEELFNPNVVKLVMDHKGYVLYFSRAAIPWNRDDFAQLSQADHKLSLAPEHYLRHIGLYAYRAGFIKQYVQWQPTALEQIESLEQLRVLWYGEKIHAELALAEPAVGVDTPEDLAKVRSILAENRSV